jgi:hypothetical protein
MAPLTKPTSIEFREGPARIEGPSVKAFRLLSTPLCLGHFLCPLVALGVFGLVALYPSQAQVSAVAPAIKQVANSSSSSPGTPVLPSHLAAVNQVAVQGSQLALDSDGTLFRSDDHGKHWRQIHQQWAGKAVELIGIPPLSAASKSGQPAKPNGDSEVYVAVLLRSTPELRWLSVDRGKTWQPANPEERRPVKWSAGNE